MQKNYLSAFFRRCGFSLPATLIVAVGLVIPARAAPAPDAELTAAFKLFAVYLAVDEGCRLCFNWGYAEESRKSVISYARRNGNSLGMINKVMREHGGSPVSFRAAIETYKAVYLEGAPAGSSDCPDFLQKVDNGEWDLYKGRPWAKEYKLLSK